MFAPILITPPASTPVTLAEAKAHLRVEHSEEDTLISGLISAATSYLDGWTGILVRALVTQTWRQDFSNFCSKMRLPLYPVASVSSVNYIDVTGATISLASTEFELLADQLGAYISPKAGKAWPVTGEGAVMANVTYIAGVASPDVPQAIKQAILLMIGDWYRSRETVAIGVTTERIALSATVSALLTPFRRGQI
jgi:uncharacterized phiE125 gp8 family phage protein